MSVCLAKKQLFIYSIKEREREKRKKLDDLSAEYLLAIETPMEGV